MKVLTQEDWNEVLYNGMEKTSSWAALYFIALMTFGNYVLFNLLVAILVEGFSTEDEPKKIEDRIRADAIQAIVSQEAVVMRKQQQQPIPTSQRRVSSIDSKQNSQRQKRGSVRNRQQKQSEQNFIPSQPSIQPPVSTSTPAPTIQIPVPFMPVTNTTVVPSLANNQSSSFVPIIIHTCPTPAQTPPSSTHFRDSIKSTSTTASAQRRGSFFMPNKSYKILFNTRITDRQNEDGGGDEDGDGGVAAAAHAVCENFLMSRTDSLRRVRKLSLDCMSSRGLD